MIVCTRCRYTVQARAVQTRASLFSPPIRRFKKQMSTYFAKPYIYHFGSPACGRKAKSTRCSAQWTCYKIDVRSTLFEIVLLYFRTHFSPLLILLLAGGARHVTPATR